MSSENKSTGLFFLCLTVLSSLAHTHTHTLPLHMLILHALLVIGFSSYRLNMSPTTTRLFCLVPSPHFSQTRSLSYTHKHRHTLLYSCNKRESPMNESLYSLQLQSHGTNSSTEIHTYQSPGSVHMSFNTLCR